MVAASPTTGPIHVTSPITVRILDAPVKVSVRGTPGPQGGQGVQGTKGDQGVPGILGNGVVVDGGNF